ncbi:MAG: transcription factor E [archaeon]|uniref:transcription factor E n=1 Tax=Methanobrevibacter TaxID=2172 RepID=UPI00084BE9C2|nr:MULTISPECIES: transcription factor E [Methanobrevibacter]MCQ2970357.1 transcription factor E [archaeon]OEC95189.1 transcription factor E [Methanobrevibacter sp. A27]
MQYIANDIRETVEKTISPIIKSLIDGVETDEEIAEKTGIKLNIVRKILYKLYDLKIANYKRSKDPETQWFTYSWKFEESELINRIKSDSETELSELNAKLENEEHNMFFVCPYGHVRFNFDTAADPYYEFLCPACGEELEFQDNAEIIEKLKNNIEIAEDNYNSFIEKIDNS